MSRIPDELIEQIRDSADLVGIIGEAVPLKRAGADWRGACPFHGGTHRNFAVIPKKGMYYCYVCHEAGDVFTYLMKKHGMDYPTAVREVARKSGIVVPERGAREGPDPREPLFTAASAAQEWFAAQLRDHAEAAGAREYLTGREISQEVAGEHGLGYAPTSRTAFREAMKALGVEEPVLLEAGLLSKRDDGSIGPRFRGRLLFPIRDLRGRVVGFGGRILGPGEPKYLNSPETPIFHKGSMLYNLHEAKQAIRREEDVVLVEGYFDVLRLVQAGIDHVIAPLGTALTPDQASLLRRFTKVVTLLYDSDGAGLKATFRTADECLRHGMRVRVATMPEGEDPDTLVRTGGAPALAPILKDAIDVLDRKIQLLERKGWFEGLEHRRDALDRLLPTARAASDPIQRDLYLDLISKKTGVSVPVLQREMAQRPDPQPPAPSPQPPAPRAPTRVRVPGARLEQQLLKTLFGAGEWLQRARAEVPAETFEVPVFREIFAALVALPPGSPIGAVPEGLSPEGRDAFERLARAAAEEREAGLNLDEVYVGALAGLRTRALSRTLPPVAAVEQRRQQLKDLSPDQRTRFFLRKAATRDRRNPGDRGPDHSQHS